MAFAYTPVSLKMNKNDAYHSSLESFASCTPFVGSYIKDGKTINVSFLGEITFDSTLIENTIYTEWNCMTCRRRFRILSKLRDQNGAIFRYPKCDHTPEANKVVLLTENFHKTASRNSDTMNWSLRPVAKTGDWDNYYKNIQTKIDSLTNKINEMKDEVTKTDPINITSIMLTNGKISEYTKEKAVLKKELIMVSNFSKLSIRNTGPESEFSHYYIQPDNFSDSEVNLGKIQKAFNTYIPLMLNLFSSSDYFGANWEAITNSLKMLLKILSSVDYGKQLVASTSWFLGCFNRSTKPFNNMTLDEKMDFIGKAIISAPISDGRDGTVVITFFHQINNNVLNLLSIAHDEHAMAELVRERMSPDNYRRKTALKAGNIDVAQKHLGDFTTTLMNTDMLEKHDHVIKVKQNNYQTTTTASGGSIYDTLRTKTAKNNLSGPAKFAARANSSVNSTTKLPSYVGKNMEGNYCMTILELMENTKNGNIFKLEVCASSNVPTNAFVADCTLSRKKLIFDHLWLYLNYQSNRFKNYGKIEITHLVPIVTHTRKNIIFVLKGAREAIKARPINNNCCLPEFLSSA